MVGCDRDLLNECVKLSLVFIVRQVDVVIGLMDLRENLVPKVFHDDGVQH